MKRRYVNKWKRGQRKGRRVKEDSGAWCAVRALLMFAHD